MDVVLLLLLLVVSVALTLASAIRLLWNDSPRNIASVAAFAALTVLVGAFDFLVR